MVALYAYQAQRTDELSFAANDVFTVLDRSDADWWHGQLLSGCTGLFPSNYVTAAAAADNERKRPNSELAVPSDMQRMLQMSLSGHNDTIENLCKCKDYQCELSTNSQYGCV